MAFFNPVTVQKLRRFRSISRGFWSFVIISAMILISFFAELFINSRALVVSYEGKWYFPTYGEMIPGTTFGLDRLRRSTTAPPSRRLPSDSWGK